MKIALIGAGNIGGNLARLFSRAGHEVVISNSRGPETLAELASEINVLAKSSVEAVVDADVVVVTVPLIAVATFTDELIDAIPVDAVVIDTNNYYPQRDGRIEEIEQGVTESRWLQKRLKRTVVKAFNSIYFTHLITKSTPSGDPARLALPIAGDDEKAKQLVAELIDEIGFDVVDAGSLDESWRQQPGSPVYGADVNASEARRLLADAVPNRHKDWRAAE